MPHIDYRSNIDHLPFFANGSVHLIYCSHALEYFDREEAVQVLGEWRRVLMPGGLLRLAVPDFEALIYVYRQTDSIERVLGPLYGRMEINMREGPTRLFHKTCYNELSLTNLLHENGFGSVERWDWRQTEHADVDDHSQAYFPHMDKERGHLISLNLQARRSP